ncbi:uncharacterized protein [Eleutherodactylus coqui]|uniref:uncharacterized protein n=1 Tax=Eleutherodactylus coqui TaxID=57060 RepID=UPI0034618160
MMDCGRKTLIVLTLCALVGANEAQPLVTILDILVSIPSTHIGDTEIVCAVLNATADHPFRYTVVAQKNQTKCINSTDPLCLSLIQPPALDVSVSSKASNGENVLYSVFINGSLELAVHIGPEVSVRPEMVSGGNDVITILLDITYNQNTTIKRSFTSKSGPPPPSKPRPRPPSKPPHVEVIISGEIITTIPDEDNGETALRSAPLCALLLLALLPVLLLK